MRTRHWVSIVAVVSVLLHAGLLVVHNTAMLAAMTQPASVLEFSAICSNGHATKLTPAQNPGLPVPAKNASHCPACIGAAPVVAVLGDDAWQYHAPPVAAAEFPVLADSGASRSGAALPPVRAPPSHA